MEVEELRRRLDTTLEQVGTTAVRRSPMNLETLEELYAHMDWADSMVWHATLDRFIEVELGRRADPVTLGETIYQVVAHSMYHRGQANRRLREIGGEPPLVDYIAWLWLGRPDPVWVM